MNQIFITGDTHHLQDTSRIEMFDSRIGKDLTADDYLIIVGDFGGVWTGQKIRNVDFPRDYYASLNMLDYDNETQVYWEKKPYTVLFIDGNHENHDALNLYPTEVWNGGKIHRVYKNTLHLMRGQVFTIGRRTFFTMGGAETTDMDRRLEGFSWWKREIPVEEEFEEALSILEEYDFSVDYVLTHCCPEGVIRYFERSPNILTRFFDNLITAYKIQFKEWYFGHYHADKDFNNFHCLFNRVIRLE